MKDGKELPEAQGPVQAIIPHACDKWIRLSVKSRCFIPHNTLIVPKASTSKGQFVALPLRSVLLSILNLPVVNLFFH